MTHIRESGEIPHPANSAAPVSDKATILPPAPGIAPTLGADAAREGPAGAGGASRHAEINGAAPAASLYADAGPARLMDGVCTVCGNRGLGLRRFQRDGQNITLHRNCVDAHHRLTLAGYACDAIPNLSSRERDEILYRGAEHDRPAKP